MTSRWIVEFVPIQEHEVDMTQVASCWKDVHEDGWPASAPMHGRTEF